MLIYCKKGEKEERELASGGAWIQVWVCLSLSLMLSKTSNRLERIPAGIRGKYLVSLANPSKNHISFTIYLPPATQVSSAEQGWRTSRAETRPKAGASGSSWSGAPTTGPVISRRACGPCRGVQTLSWELKGCRRVYGRPGQLKRSISNDPWMGKMEKLVAIL